MPDEQKFPRAIPPHGEYQNLMSYQMAEIVFDATNAFCKRFISIHSRTHDQMVQASRSGKQNIAEGCMASGTSKKTEIKLMSVARASLEELLLDYLDFLRQQKLPVWPKEHPDAREVRTLCYKDNRTYMTYRTYIEEKTADISANTIVCLLHQTNYLLDQQLRILEKAFIKEGGFTEKLYRARSEYRKRKKQV